MTTEQLSNHITHLFCCSGEVRYEICYRNKIYSCRSNDTLSYDRIQERDEIDARVQNQCGLTLKQAYLQLYRDGLKQHHLSTYKID